MMMMIHAISVHIPARTAQRWVQGIWPIGGANDNHMRPRIHIAHHPLLTTLFPLLLLDLRQRLHLALRL
jgi:hypothetical protein